MNGKSDAFKIILLNISEQKKLNQETRLCILCAKELDFAGLMTHLQQRQVCLNKNAAYHEKMNRYLLFMEHNKLSEGSLSAHTKKEMLFEYLELLDYSMQIDALSRDFTALSETLSKELGAVKSKLASPDFNLPLQVNVRSTESSTLKKARAID